MPRQCNFCRYALEIDGCDQYPNKGHCPVDWKPDPEETEEVLSKVEPVKGLVATLFGRAG